MDIAVLKIKVGAKTSESLFGVSPQPPDTCPMIDAIIAEIRECEQDSRYISKQRDDSEIGEFSSELSNIENNAYRVQNKVEDLRKEVEKVRAWGEEWKGIAKELLSRVCDDKDNLDEFISADYIDKVLDAEQKDALLYEHLKKIMPIIQYPLM